MSESLILVTSYDGLMADGRRVAWQSFRPASAAPGTKPTVYFTTLGAAPDPDGTTRTNLVSAGVQGIHHAVVLTVLSGPAELTLADGTVLPLPVGTTVTVPARGGQNAAVLSFGGEQCSLRVEPQRGGAAARLLESAAYDGATEGDGDEGGSPPPPTPGDGD